MNVNIKAPAEPFYRADLKLYDTAIPYDFSTEHPHNISGPEYTRGPMATSVPRTPDIVSMSTDDYHGY